ncbi:hypothetical protein D3C86_1548620 [compost metagenome]
MAEEIGGFRACRLLGDQATKLDLLQGFEQLLARGAHGAECQEHGEAERAADDACHLEHQLLLRRQAIQAARDRPFDGAGQLQVAGSARLARAADTPFDHQLLRLAERERQLLAEEGVAFRPLPDQSHGGIGDRRGPQSLLHQADGLLEREAAQGEAHRLGLGFHALKLGAGIRPERPGGHHQQDGWDALGDDGRQSP